MVPETDTDTLQSPVSSEPSIKQYKVEIRLLEPGLTEEDFLSHLSEHWKKPIENFYYVEGALQRSSHKEFTYSRAYVSFPEEATSLEFIKHMKGIPLSQSGLIPKVEKSIFTDMPSIPVIDNPHAFDLSGDYFFECFKAYLKSGEDYGAFDLMKVNAKSKKRGSRSQASKSENLVKEDENDIGSGKHLEKTIPVEINSSSTNIKNSDYSSEGEKSSDDITKKSKKKKSRGTVKSNPQTDLVTVKKPKSKKNDKTKKAIKEDSAQSKCDKEEDFIAVETDKNELVGSKKSKSSKLPIPKKNMDNHNVSGDKSKKEESTNINVVSSSKNKSKAKAGDGERKPSENGVVEGDCQIKVPKTSHQKKSKVKGETSTTSDAKEKGSTSNPDGKRPKNTPKKGKVAKKSVCVA